MAPRRRASCFRRGFSGCRERGDGRLSDQPQPLEAGVAVPADDDVVVDRDAEGLGRLDDGLRHVDVGVRRRRVARGVVVDEPHVLKHRQWLRLRTATHYGALRACTAGYGAGR